MKKSTYVFKGYKEKSGTFHRPVPSDINVPSEIKENFAQKVGTGLIKPYINIKIASNSNQKASS